MKKQIPNILTSANLFCGVLAIVFVVLGEIRAVMLLVGLSLMFDFLDGMVARLLKVHSPLGKELDSLADMVSFGVLPGFIMARLIRQAQGFDMLPEAGYSLFDEPPTFLIAFLIPVFSALRLAKFNLDERQGDSFYGLPTPANTLWVLSFWLMTYFYPKDWLGQLLQQDWLLMGLSIVCSFLLVLEMRLIALKFKSWSWEGNRFRYLLIILSLLLLAFFQLRALPFTILVYILLSAVQNLLDNRS
jgi:CDP-diacylglycerol--serine O-phosphatidyltransferase